MGRRHTGDKHKGRILAKKIFKKVSFGRFMPIFPSFSGSGAF
jgi:hypothetical protein